MNLPAAEVPSVSRVLPDGRTLEAFTLLFGGRLGLTIRPEDVGAFYDDAW